MTGTARCDQPGQLTINPRPLKEDLPVAHLLVALYDCDSGDYRDGTLDMRSPQ